MTVTKDLLEQLERQREYFASDDHIKERAAVWRDATPEECLAAVAESCAEAEQLLQIKTPDVLDRVLALPSIPDDTIAILEALQRPSRR